MMMIIIIILVIIMIDIMVAICLYCSSDDDDYFCYSSVSGRSKWTSIKNDSLRQASEQKPIFSIEDPN